MTYIEELLLLVGDHRRALQPSANDWKEAESSTGIPAPDDFRDLVSAFGYGKFGDLCLVNPCAQDPFFEYSPEGFSQRNELFEVNFRRLGFNLKCTGKGDGDAIVVGAGITRAAFAYQIGKGYYFLDLDLDIKLGPWSRLDYILLNSYKCNLASADDFQNIHRHLWIKSRAQKRAPLFTRKGT